MCNGTHIAISNGESLLELKRKLVQEFRFRS